MADIKPIIKPDPEALGASPGGTAFEDDIYEDAGDLEFNTDHNYQKAFLARIPKELWEAWSTLDEDAEIQIGTVRVKKSEKSTGGQTEVRITPSLCYRKEDNRYLTGIYRPRSRCCSTPTLHSTS